MQKGQLLAQIDPRPFQAALDQAIGTLQRDQGLLNEAKMDLVRFQNSSSWIPSRASRPKTKPISFNRTRGR